MKNIPKTSEFKTPRQQLALQKKELMARLKALKAKMPTNWILLFIHDNRQYSGQQSFLSNVIRGMSMHLPTIEIIEDWADKLPQNQNK